MIVAEGHRQLSAVGFARFSAREVAKRIGYSIGTIYNVFQSHDLLILALNARTLEQWEAHLRARLAQRPDERLRALVEAYFEFALLHRHAWAALYDHRLPDDQPMPAYYVERLTALTGIVLDEVAAALPPDRAGNAAPLARSLLASVHGHCAFTLNGTFTLLGETEPVEAALARVREAIDRV